MQKEDREFTAVLKSIPMPIPCLNDGVACPWCGHITAKAIFGEMECTDCRKSFFFGFPQWHDGEGRPESFVNFPWKAFDEFKSRAVQPPAFQPNDQLQKLYDLFWPDKEATENNVISFQEAVKKLREKDDQS